MSATTANHGKDMTFAIGNVALANRVVAAPMAGVTDRAFRELARRAGCSLVVTEMVSDQAVIHGNRRTWKMLEFEAERPLSVQIFGSDPDRMARAAQLVEERGASIIDINMGCPTPKIVKNGEGAALMREPLKAAEIVRRVARAVSVPVTVKMRKGWDEGSVNAVEVARLVVEAGAKAVAIHGRTRSQFYSGKADWSIIRAVKAAVPVPVIGNGDVRTPADAARMLAETGCDAVMIGRAALGNPWLFHQVAHYLATGEILPGPSWAERLDMVLHHFALLVAYKGEGIAVREMRKHASWYTHGLPGAARVREKVNQARSRAELIDVLKTWAEGEKD